MRSRRVILTIEAETDLPLADLRQLGYVGVPDRAGHFGAFMLISWQPNSHQHRIVQVQVNAIKPERKAKRAKGAK